MSSGVVGLCPNSGGGRWHTAHGSLARPAVRQLAVKALEEFFESPRWLEVPCPAHTGPICPREQEKNPGIRRQLDRQAGVVHSYSPTVP